MLFSFILSFLLIKMIIIIFGNCGRNRKSHMKELSGCVVDRSENVLRLVPKMRSLIAYFECKSLARVEMWIVRSYQNQIDPQITRIILQQIMALPFHLPLISFNLSLTTTKNSQLLAFCYKLNTFWRNMYAFFNFRVCLNKIIADLFKKLDRFEIQQWCGGKMSH